MSSIGNVEKNHQLLIENARRKADREIKHIENIHQNNKAELKKSTELEIQDFRESNRHQIAQEAEKKEKILQELKSHLQQTKDLTEKELSALDSENMSKRQKIKEKFLIDRDQTNAEHEVFIQDLNERFNSASRKVRHDGQARVETMKTEISEEITDQERKHRDRLDNDRETFGREYKTVEQNQRKVQDQQNLQFKTERMSTNLNQMAQLKKMTEGHEGQLEVRDREFRKGFKEQDLFFEKKFKDQVTRHQSSYKDLEKKNQEVIEKLKDSLTKEITVSANRIDDPFYKFEKLNPKLKHFEDRVEINVKVPGYAKQDIQLAINGKEAIMSFNRRYHDASKSEDGTINKINKVESFTTRLKTDYHLDAKSLKSSYDDGMMTFTIKKA